MPAEYGVVSEYYAYVTFLMILYTFGMETAFFHFSTKTGDRDKVFGNGLITLIITSSIISGILILFSHAIANRLGYPNHPEYIVWFALILAFDGLTALPFARLRQLGKAKLFAGLKMLNIILNIGFNVFFLSILPEIAKHHPDSWMLFCYNPTVGVGYVFLANLISSSITLLLLLPDFKNIKFPLDKELLKAMIIYSFPILIAGFAGMINETLDRAILKYLVTDKVTAMQQLGIYSACYKLSILMTLFVQTFRYAAEPFFFAQQHKENAKQLYANVMNYFVLICSIIFLGVMLYIDVVKIFIGHKYYSGLHVVPILLIANLCLGIYLNLSLWYKLTGQTRYGAWLSVYGAIITILFNLWLIPKMGYTGAAWATLICYASMMIFSYLLGQKIFPVPYELKKIALFVGAAIFVWGLSILLRKFTPDIPNYYYSLNTLLFLIYIGVMWKIMKGDKNFSLPFFKKQKEHS